MTRAVAAVAFVGFLFIGLAYAAGPGDRLEPRAPRHEQTPQPERSEPAPLYTPIASDIWTEPGGTFSFAKPTTWTDIDTASEVGAPVLELVARDDTAECWFTRVPRPSTAALTPAQLIKIRSAPLTNDIWSKVGARAHQALDGDALGVTAVERVGYWPVQTARFKTNHRDVLAALHSRPGLDIWAFCDSRDGKDHDALLRAVALSVTTPKDSIWEKMISGQANLTAVP